MSGPRAQTLEYAEGAPVRARRRTLIALAAALVIGGICTDSSNLVSRVVLLYWQRRCANYDDARPVWLSHPSSAWRGGANYVRSWDGSSALAASAPMALYPVCWQKLSRELAIEGSPVSNAFFDDRCWPIVFLHERVSPGGSRRIVCMQLRPNIDHAQMCSVDCAVITPASIVSPPRVSAAVAAWIPGWWTCGIRKDKLMIAKADPNDSSHFVFEYENNAPASDPSGWNPDGPFHAAADQTSAHIFIVDGWLKDDGSVEVRLREQESIPH